MRLVVPERLARPEAHGLLLTRVFMYPGAFTVVGLARGLSEALAQRGVFRRGADAYARAQRRPKRLIRRVFTHDARKGRRPSFTKAAAPAAAEELFTQFVNALRRGPVPVAAGFFQCHMHVELLNDGPVTLLLER